MSVEKLVRQASRAAGTTPATTTVMRPMPRRVLVVCATHRDRRELARLGLSNACLFHDYASDELERIAGTPSHAAPPIADPELEIQRLTALAREEGVRAVLSTDDYPGTTLAAIVAARLGLPGPSPRATLLAQHKYCARVIGREIAPDATPAFELSSGAPPRLLGEGPVFVKPCKSFFSVGAQPVDRPADWHDAARAALLPPRFFSIFDELFRAYAGSAVTARTLLVERLVRGVQCTVEGVRQAGVTHLLGIVDSIYRADGRSFARFEYPSSLPEAVQERMAVLATRVIVALGYDDGGFNVEMTWDPNEDHVWIIEVNPRSSSQFADLFEKVDGVNTYSLLVDIAQGRLVRPPSRQGRYPFAASCVLRRFEDAHVERVPTEDDIARIETIAPDARVEILATQGKSLSDELQDGSTYRYGNVDVGAEDRDEALALLATIERALPFRFETRARRDAGEPCAGTARACRERQGVGSCRSAASR